MGKAESLTILRSGRQRYESQRRLIRKRPQKKRQGDVVDRSSGAGLALESTVVGMPVKHISHSVPVQRLLELQRFVHGLLHESLHGRLAPRPKIPHPRASPTGRCCRASNICPTSRTGDFQDARLTPASAMTDDDVAHWTQAISERK